MIRVAKSHTMCPYCGKRKVCYRIFSTETRYEERVIRCGRHVIVEVVNPLTSGLVYEAQNVEEAIASARKNVELFDKEVW